MRLSELHHEKTCLMTYANNKDADQPAHPHSLISTFVFHCLDSTIPILTKSKSSRLLLVCVAEQAGLSLTWPQSPKDRFSCDVAKKWTENQHTPVIIVDTVHQTLTMTLSAIPKFCFAVIVQEPPHDKTNKMTVHPAKTQISLGIRPVCSEFSLCAQWVAKDPSFFHADSEDSDQTGRMPRLIRVFAGRICHFVCFVMR